MTSVTSAFCLSLLLLCLNAYLVRSSSPTPIVLWHGMGDNCCEPNSIGGFKTFLEKNIPGVHVLSLRIGQNLYQDKMNSMFMSLDRQMKEACRQIQQDPKLKNGYHGVGFSQGGLFIRAIAQVCPVPQMRSLVTFGGPHQGVFGIPSCNNNVLPCEQLRRIGTLFTYQSWIQKIFVPFQYWHNPLNRANFIRNSLFLSEVNNEKRFIQSYKDNLMKLKKFVMIQFNFDQALIPVQTQHFGFYKPGQMKQVLNLNETDLYKSDLLGLKQMNMQGKLVFLDINTRHMVLDYDWIKKNVLRYLV